MTEQADPSMADLFGEESDADDTAQSTQPTATQPDSSDGLNSTQSAINERDLFGSDDEDEDADDGAAADTADPYTRRGSAVLDLEQQLAEVDEDGSALDEEAARDADEAAANEAAQPAQHDKDDESQESKRDKALAKRKKSMSSKAHDDDNDSTSSSQLNEEPSRSSSNRKSKPSKSSSPSPTRPILAPATASGPPLSLLASPAAPFAATAKLHLVRLPNVIGVQANAFHPDSYEEEVVGEEAEEVVGQGRTLLEGQRKKSKAVSLMVENVIRWREVRDEGEGGPARRESNTRLVRWSDGTSSLLIGNECFDVVQSTADPHRNYVYLQQAAFQSTDPDDMSDSPPPHSQPRSRPQLLRSVGAFTGHIKFKVTGIDSDSHRKLKDVLFETHTKKARIVMEYNEVNPEKLRQEEERQAREDDKKRSRQLARERGGGGGGGGGGRRSGGGSRWGAQAAEDDELGDFLEEDDNPSEKARRRKGDYEADVGRLKRAKEGDERGAEEADADFVEADDEEQQDEEEEGGDLDEDEILGRKRTARSDTAGEPSEGTAEGEASAPVRGTARAEDVDDDLVLHGASKRRRVLADEEESD